jgi:hypothetical protein
MTGQVPMWQESPGVAPAPAVAPGGVPPHGRCDRGKPSDATAHPDHTPFGCWGCPAAGFLIRRRAFGFCWRYGVTHGLIAARTSAPQQAAPGAWAADF